MKQLTVLLLVLFATFSAFSQQEPSITLEIDSAAFCEKSVLELRIVLTKRNGKTRLIDSTSALSKWRNVQITSPFISSIDKGTIRIDQTKIHADQHEMLLAVTVGKRKTEVRLQLPYVSRLRIQSDTILINRLIPLRYELEFSNGRTVPADSTIFPFNALQLMDDNVQLSNGAIGYYIPHPVTVTSGNWTLTDRRNGKVLAEFKPVICYPVSYLFHADGKTGLTGRRGEYAVGVAGPGSDGEAGGEGMYAGSVDVFIRQEVIAADTILSFFTIGPEMEDLQHVRFARGSTFTLSAKGGTGGVGGWGTWGETGLIDKEKNINEPFGGDGGDGGNGGQGGNGGDVTLTVTPETRYLLPLITVMVDGGAGGPGGVGGYGGRGDYSNASLLGTLIDWRDGSDGSDGKTGETGQSGTVSQVVLPTEGALREACNEALNRNRIQNSSWSSLFR